MTVARVDLRALSPDFKTFRVLSVAPRIAEVWKHGIAATIKLF